MTNITHIYISNIYIFILTLKFHVQLAIWYVKSAFISICCFLDTIIHKFTSNRTFSPLSFYFQIEGNSLQTNNSKYTLLKDLIILLFLSITTCQT